MTLSELHANIDKSVHRLHSTWAIATSKAIYSIMKAVNWASDSTSHKFYKEQVDKDYENRDSSQFNRYH